MNLIKIAKITSNYPKKQNFCDTLKCQPKDEHMLHVHWIFTKYIFLEIKATKSLSHAYKHSCQNNKITERKNIKKTLEIFRFYDNEGTIYCNNVVSFKIVVREIKKINSIVTSSFNKCMFHFILIVCSIVFHAIVQNIGNAIFESFQSRQIFFCTKNSKNSYQFLKSLVDHSLISAFQPSNPTKTLPTSPQYALKFPITKNESALNLK